MSTKDVCADGKPVPSISESQLMAQYRNDLQRLIKKAIEDGEITMTEYDELRNLTEKIGVSDLELSEMIRMAFKKDLITKVQLFVENDGKVDKNEMRSLAFRANKVGISESELDTYINEALAKYDTEHKKKFRDTMRKIGKGTLIVAGVTAAAAATVLGIAASQGNISISHIVHHSSR